MTLEWSLDTSFERRGVKRVAKKEHQFACLTRAIVLHLRPQYLHCFVASLLALAHLEHVGHNVSVTYNEREKDSHEHADPSHLHERLDQHGDLNEEHAGVFNLLI